MFVLVSFILVIASLILKNDVMLQAAGLFGIAGAIELIGSNINKRIDKVKIEKQ